MVGVTVSAVKTASNENTVERGSSGDNEVQLVPVVGSWVPPGYSVVWFGVVERVGYTEVMVRA